MSAPTDVSGAGGVQPLRQLAALVRTFGRRAARAKLGALEALDVQARWTARDLRLLHDVASFALAYPDDAGVRRQARELAAMVRERLVLPLRDRLVNSGLPGTTCEHPYSLPVARRLVEIAPEAVEIDWDLLEDKGPLHELLAVLVGALETPGLDDVDISTRAWLERSRGRHASALAFVLSLLGRSGLDEVHQATLYEACAMPLRLDLDAVGRAGCEVSVPPARVHHQRTPIQRGRWPVAPEVRRPLARARRLPRGAARRLLDAALWALASRTLEIYSLSYASPDDVVVASCGRGLEVAVCGVEPVHRCALEGLYFLLVTKNGVPIAYGPATPLFGCSEMGINFFEEFRGAETRHVYTQVMRVQHHVLGVQSFHVTPYGMGKDNEPALRSGAFWFYRKLGFSVSNPRVEALAREEEARLRSEPGYRCSRGTLRRLSQTDATLDLSAGRCRRFDSTALGFVVGERVEDEHGGDRRGAEREATTRVADALRVRDLSRWTGAERTSLERVAPALAAIPDLADWSARERASVIRIVRGKAAPSETRAVRAMARHARLEASLRSLVEL